MNCKYYNICKVHSKDNPCMWYGKCSFYVTFLNNEKGFLNNEKGGDINARTD